MQYVAHVTKPLNGVTNKQLKVLATNCARMCGGGGVFSHISAEKCW